VPAERGSDRDDQVGRIKRRLWLERVVLLLIIGVLAGLYLGALPGPHRVCLIAADGQPVTVVESRADAERMLDEIKANSGLPSDRVSFSQKVTLHNVSSLRNPVQSDSEAMKALSPALQVTTRAAAVVANGELVLALSDQEEAVRTLSLLLKRLSPAGPIASTYFKERIKVEMRDVAPDKVVESAEEAVRKLSEAASPKGEHEVKSGDSAWGIARQYGVSLNRLGHANPGRDLERLRVGDKLKIPGMLAGLTVVATKEIEEKVGEGPRQRAQKVRITYENGVEVSRQVIGRERLRVEGVAPPSERAPLPRRGRDIWRWRDEIPE